MFTNANIALSDKNLIPFTGTSANVTSFKVVTKSLLKAYVINKVWVCYRKFKLIIMQTLKDKIFNLNYFTAYKNKYTFID